MDFAAVKVKIKCKKKLWVATISCCQDFLWDYSWKEKQQLDLQIPSQLLEVRICRLQKYLKRLWFKNFTHNSNCRRLCDRSLGGYEKSHARVSEVVLTTLWTSPTHVRMHKFGEGSGPRFLILWDRLIDRLWRIDGKKLLSHSSLHAFMPVNMALKALQYI